MRRRRAQGSQDPQRQVAQRRGAGRSFCVTVTVRLCGLVFLLLLFSTAAGAVEGRARATLGTEPPVWVGQRVVLYVDLVTTGFMFSGQRFRLPEIPGAILLESEVSTTKLSETVAGETWQVLRYEFSLFPQRPGELTVPEIGVTFAASQGYGQEAVPFQLATEPVRLAVQLPPGVADPAAVVTAHELEVEISWQPEVAAGKVGDAFTRTVRWRATDVSGMAFPPLPVPRVDGLAAYPKQPFVKDVSNRGLLVGERAEAVTLIAQRPGTYRIPEIVVQWWDPVEKRLREKRFEELILEVAPNPALAGPASADSAATRLLAEHPVAVAVVAALVAVLFFAGWKLRRRALAAWREWQSRRAEREARYFNAVARACRRADPAAAYRTLGAWITRCGIAKSPVTLDALAKAHPEPELLQELEGLQEALCTGDGGWSGATLLKALRPVRKKRRKRARRSDNLALPPLNPTGPVRVRRDTAVV